MTRGHLMNVPLVGFILLWQWQNCLSYYQSQYGMVAPLEPNRETCINMIPPYVGRKPFRNQIPLKLEIDSEWISHKRVSVCAYSAPDRYQAFAGIMVQMMKDNLPIGHFENETRTEIVDCPPGHKNLACLRSSFKLLQAAVNWVSPPDFDVYTKQLHCVVTIISLNQKYWTVEFPIEAAPYKYPEYGNFTSDLKKQSENLENVA